MRRELSLDWDLGLFPALRERDGPLPTSGSSREEEIVSAPSLSITSAPRGFAHIDAALDGMCFQASDEKSRHSTPSPILMGQDRLNSTNSFGSGQGLTGGDCSEQQPDDCSQRHSGRAPERDTYCAYSYCCAAGVCSQSSQQCEEGQ